MSMDDGESRLGAPTLVLLFTTYYFAERVLRRVISSHAPSFFLSLQKTRKDLVFFGISMGLLISLLSTPYCASAVWTIYHNSSGSPTDSWFLDSDAQTCIASRAVLWVSELNRLDLYPLYVVHHAGSISSLLAFLHLRWPRLPYLLILSTLISEVPGDIIWMLSAYVDSMKQDSNHHPRLAKAKLYFGMFNVAQYALIRGTGWAIAAYLLARSSVFGFDEEDSMLVRVLTWSFLGLYGAFCASYVVRQSLSIRAQWKAGPRRATHLRIPTRPAILLVPYGLFMGLGFAALVLTALAFAPASATSTTNLNLKLALQITLLSAVLGARLFSLVMEDGITALFSRPIQTLFRPGFWLHGGLLGAAVGAVGAHRLGLVLSLPRFVASLAMGLPLYEACSRVGCWTYGCCYGSPVCSSHRRPLLWRLFPFPATVYASTEPSDYAVTRLDPALQHQPLVPIQLISSALFALLFLCISLPLAVLTNIGVEGAGATTLALHAIVRLATETCRADYRGAVGAQISTTGRIALGQGVGAGMWLAWVLYHDQSLPSASRSGGNILGWEQAQAAMMAALLGMLAYGVHVERIGSWVPDSKCETKKSSESTGQS
ncbi:Prolipo protein diacylglyceryl transferase-domain-containing protein [Mycena amicta]|nr:Prolipo protein diacylglyceryl transferase-domain-containing protein [Mycena amicta]